MEELKVKLIEGFMNQRGYLLEKMTSINYNDASAMSQEQSLKEQMVSIDSKISEILAQV